MKNKVERVEYLEVDIPATIRYVRKSENLTQKELARLFGFAPSSISMWELGEREAPYKLLEYIFAKCIEYLKRNVAKEMLEEVELDVIEIIGYANGVMADKVDTKMHRYFNTKSAEIMNRIKNKSVSNITKQ